MAAAAAYDLIVIGGGSGGSAMARRSAGYGAKVCIIERGACRDANGIRKGGGFGGTCVNVGCVPKKLMFLAAQQREAMVGSVATAAGFGYQVPEAAGRVDWAALKARRDAYVEQLSHSYAGNWEKAGIKTLVGLATFIDSKTVRVELADGSAATVTAPEVVLACGGEPMLPDIPGKELAISSDGFFDLDAQPRKVAVVGAGYIAVELGCIFHGLGTEVDLFFRGKTVLRRGFDPFIVGILMDAMEAHGPNLRPESTLARLERAADGTITCVTKHTETGQEASYAGFDQVLLAIGRRPRTELLALDKAGVKTDAKGRIEVDAYENTSVPGIYAIGDVSSSGHELTPVAIAAGRRLADRLFGKEPRARIAYELIATVVFSHPPIGYVGLTEPQAREAFGDENITVKQTRFFSMLYTFNDPAHKVETGLKLVLKGPEELVVGLHCIGPASDEMLQGFAVAVRMGATRADLEGAVALHPTIAEELVTFGGWGQTKASDGTTVPQLPPYLRSCAGTGGG